MKFLVIWMFIPCITCNQQIEKFVFGFSDLATCGKAQQSISRQAPKYPNRKLWTTIFIKGGGQHFYFERCQ